MLFSLEGGVGIFSYIKSRVESMGERRIMCFEDIVHFEFMLQKFSIEENR